MIALGCDHGGYELKQEIIKYLEENHIEYQDFGCDSTDSTDYPIYAKRVAIAIQNGDCEKGILVCGTGIGISITANKFKGIRAALCSDCFSAEATRLHNNANILAMGGRVVGRTSYPPHQTDRGRYRHYGCISGNLNKQMNFKYRPPAFCGKPVSVRGIL